MNTIWKNITDYLIEFPWMNLLTAIGIFLIFLVFRKLFTKYLFKVILATAKKTNVPLLTQLLLSFERPLRVFFIVIGTYVALKTWGIDMKEQLLLNRIYGSVLIVLGGWGLYNYVSTHGTFMAFAKQKLHLRDDHMLIPFISNILRFVVIALTIVACLSAMGVNVNGFIAGLGLGGLAFALAAQETVANLFGGVVIIMEKPFKKGDWISTPSVEGVVEDITFRSTKIRTFADAVVIVPNKTLSNEAITNWSEMNMRRVNYSIGVGQEATRFELQRAVEQIRELILNHPGVVQDTVMVYFDEFGESSYNIFVYYFTKTVAWSEWHEIKQEINYDILDILRDEGISVLKPIVVLDQQDDEQFQKAGESS
ncbi:mechanosensitive ion channel family protein [Shouchella clausii]|uniref:Mechanosensitive ion channel protein n=1 Tax=Shouchella clausii TaxID=79880 RepID=A0A268RYF8_SHOCL|nr:mechanosensitive ion channel family protein [Shouchella clausii]PAD44785.1 mechanosensitive ion channel protein [Bacillus sp. 7520-S]MBU8596435.1 mechanosensitive ion channel family protein [Shouchella clausii]MCY1103777.1 mechanosensitive ion channel family protein [Shouchella clausii]MEB5481146.1 mechanosensitive ion channel family protein [Shouchella clausii]MED4158368.1 mechanosensitive ion channel family protein [Shouchella clausii]